MILLSLHCTACGSYWVEARVSIGRWDSFPCLFCGSTAVDHRDHDHVAEHELRAEAA